MNLVRPRISVRFAICLGLGIVLAAVQMAPQRGAWWGLMDDAETLRWQPAAMSLRLGDLPHVLATTEVRQFGRSTRYRPVYYTVRIMEAWAWGVRPARWYAARVLLFGLALAGGAFALWAFCDSWLAAGGLALIVSGWYWSDVWAHLGPAEQYGSVGTAMVAVGAALVWRLGRSVPGLWLAAAGVVVAAGSKENFAVMLVPMLMLAWRERRAHPVTALATAALSSALVATVILALVIGFRHVTTDIYGTPVSSETRLAWVTGGPALALAALWIGFALAAITTQRTMPRDPVRAAESRGALVDLATVLLFVTILVASQLTFYAPTWPRFGSRYDFPGWLAEVLLVMSWAVFVRRWLQAQGRCVLATRFERIVAVACLAVAVRHGDFPVRVGARANAAATGALRAVLTEARDSAVARPGAPVVVEARDDREIEPALAVITILAELGSRGPFFVQPLRQPTPGIARTAILDSISRFGDQLADQQVLPIGELPAVLSAASGRVVVLRIHGYVPPTLRYRITP